MSTTSNCLLGLTMFCANSEPTLARSEARETMRRRTRRGESVAQ